MNASEFLKEPLVQRAPRHGRTSPKTRINKPFCLALFNARWGLLDKVA